MELHFFHQVQVLYLVYNIYLHYFFNSEKALVIDQNLYRGIQTRTKEKIMLNVNVTYQVKREFVEENKMNIQKFLNDFKSLDKTKFSYNVYLKDDGVTFVHTSNYLDEKTQKEILNVPSFLEFQKKRDESGLNNTHNVEILEYIGSSNKII